MSLMKRKKRGKQNEQFIPRQPKKYVGRYPIVVRSRWERMFAQWLDANPHILEWSSESVAIPYYDPVRLKKRRYFPDFYVKTKSREDRPVKYIVELKPNHELYPPKNTGKKSKKTMLYQQSTYHTNQAKFRAAEDYCKKMGLRWKVLSEENLFK
jgi:hypothetical protein